MEVSSAGRLTSPELADRQSAEMRAFIKRWRWLIGGAVSVGVVTLAATILWQSRAGSLYQRSQDLRPGMSWREAVDILGSPTAVGKTGESFSGYPNTLIWKEERWRIIVFLGPNGLEPKGSAKIKQVRRLDMRPTRLTESLAWLHRHLDWWITDKLWRWSLR
jgi:hypothetical protein